VPVKSSNSAAVSWLSKEGKKFEENLENDESEPVDNGIKHQNKKASHFDVLSIVF